MRSLPCLGAASLLCTLAVLVAVRPAAARLCLPPLFEGGQRLHPLTDVRVMWLDPLLRQHEICWRRHDHEVRIALFGNSAVFGFPLPVEQSFAARVNAQFSADAVPAHLFNLGWVFTYQVRDALIVHEALAYDPDVIVYALTLADMTHVAPLPYPPPLARFFELNADTVAALSEAPPPGLDEPFQLYRPVGERAAWRVIADHVRQLGFVAHSVAQRHADGLARRFGATPRPPRRPLTRKQPTYDCDTTLAQNDTIFRDFESWNALAYLADIQARSGRAVLIINWPVAEERQGACYNRRYGTALIAAYNRWLGEEAARLGVHYLDLHDLLSPDQFIDSLHVTPAGHQRIADRVAAALVPIVRARLAARESRASRTEHRP